jgi:hypothetical protein
VRLRSGGNGKWRSAVVCELAVFRGWVAPPSPTYDGGARAGTQATTLTTGVGCPRLFAATMSLPRIARRVHTGQQTPGKGDGNMCGHVFFLGRVYIVLLGMLIMIPDRTIQIGGAITTLVGTALGIWWEKLWPSERPVSFMSNVKPDNGPGGNLPKAA